MEVAQIFTEMSWIVAVLLSVGAVFLIVEIFVPGFGFFGVSGSLSVIAGVVVRICQGLNLTQALALALIVLAVFVVFIIVMVFSARFGFLGRTGLFETGTSIPRSHRGEQKKIRKLIGKSGKAISNLSLAGKAKIKGKIYDVQSISSYIPSGAHIKVVSIEDNKIMVRKWFE